MLDNDNDIAPTRTTKVGRISQQTKGLVEDIRTWVDLKMQFTQLDLEDRVDRKVNEAAKGAVVASIGLIALVFVLLTTAIGLGQLFDNMFYGFLAVTGVILVLLIIAMLIKPRFVNVNFTDREDSETKKLNP